MYSHAFDASYATALQQLRLIELCRALYVCVYVCTLMWFNASYAKALLQLRLIELCRALYVCVCDTVRRGTLRYAGDSPA